jgi:hypothetical protein
MWSVRHPVKADWMSATLGDAVLRRNSSGARDPRIANLTGGGKCDIPEPAAPDRRSDSSCGCPGAVSENALRAGEAAGKERAQAQVRFCRAGRLEFRTQAPSTSMESPEPLPRDLRKRIHRTAGWGNCLHRREFSRWEPVSSPKCAAASLRASGRMPRRSARGDSGG